MDDKKPKDFAERTIGAAEGIRFIIWVLSYGIYWGLRWLWQSFDKGEPTDEAKRETEERFKRHRH